MKLKFLLMLILLLPMSSMAQKVAYAVLEDSTLTFYYDDKKPEGAYDVENMVKSEFDTDEKEWFPERYHISTVVFDKSFKTYRPNSCSRWFLLFDNLTSIIGIKENLNTSEVTDMNCMFYSCRNLTSLDVSGFNTSKVNSMRIMFTNCINLTSLDISGFDTKNVTDMWGMFWGCEKLTNLDVCGFNTDKVTDLGRMFYNCESLTSLDLSKFNTDKVEDMGYMFAYCDNIQTIYVGEGWNTSNVTASNNMFADCHNLVGGQGTKYDDSHINVEYAHIDGGSDNPGYFTKK